MKIGEEERLAALAHPDPFVRAGVWEACVSFGQTGLPVTRRVMKSVDEFGLEEAFERISKFAVLELDDEAAEWVCQLIEGTDRNSYFGKNVVSHLLGWLISKAPTGFLKENKARVTSFLSQEEASHLCSVDETIAERKRRASLSDEEILQSIEDHLATLGEDTEFAEANISMIEGLVESLKGGAEGIRDKVLSALKATMPRFNEAFAASDWDFGVWILVAGHLRIGEAVPLMLEGMKMDWDWLNEEIPKCLALIGTDDCLEKTATFYEEYFDGSDECDYVRLFLSMVFGEVESPVASKLAIRLLEGERDDFSRLNLAKAITLHLDGESIGAARKVFEENPDDPERGHLVRFFYTYAILAGEEPPEMESWRALLEKEAKQIHELSHLGYTKGSMMDQIINHLPNRSGEKLAWLPELGGPESKRLEPTVTYSGKTPHVREEKKIGRNDPCPCGSGKKSKKCCGS